MQIIVYEPFQHYIPTGMGWCKGLTKLGHDVFALPSMQHTLLEIDQPVDIMILGGEEGGANNIIEFHRRQPNCKIAFWCNGYQPWFTRIEDCVTLWVEHTYKHDMSRAIFEGKGLKFANVPLAADDDLFYPTNDKKLFDISFVGQFGHSGHGDRDEQHYLFPAIDKYDGIFGGFTYDGQTFPTVPHSGLNDTYGLCKVNLNFHYPYQKVANSTNMLEYLDFNGRVFEIALGGNFQLCDAAHVKDIGFDEAIPIGRKETWMDMLDYFLKNDDHREECAKKAREVALARHTWKHRMEEFLTYL